MKVTGVRTTPLVTDEGSSKNYVDSFSGGGGSVAPGSIVMLAHGTVPTGWFLCDGAEYSQTTYATLFGIIGSAYNSHPSLGAPAGGNFRVPDLRDLFPLGMNASGPTGTTALGLYTTAGWSHTHTIGNHTHTLGNHTHTLNSHTHTIASHTHTLSGHVHGLNSHTHTYPNHGHSFGAHTHGFSLSVTAVHTHTIGARNTGNVQATANEPRSGVAGTNNSLNTGNQTYALNVGGSIGNTNNGDTGYNTDGASGTSSAASPNTNGPSADSGATNPTTGGPSANSGTPSSNTTSSDGSASTGTANPPYLGIHFIIKQ